MRDTFSWLMVAVAAWVCGGRRLLSHSRLSKLLHDLWYTLGLGDEVQFADGCMRFSGGRETGLS